MWKKNNRDEWSGECFVVVEKILRERGVVPGPQDAFTPVKTPYVEGKLEAEINRIPKPKNASSAIAVIFAGSAIMAGCWFAIEKLWGQSGHVRISENMRTMIAWSVLGPAAI